MQVQQIMNQHAEVIDPNATLRDVAKRMRRDNLGAYPVGENDRLIGMVTDRDIILRGIAEDRPPATSTVREVMSEKVFYCFDDDDVDDAAAIMADHQVRRIPVLNHEKRLVGVVALADLGLSEANSVKAAIRGVCEPSEIARRM